MPFPFWEWDVVDGISERRAGTFCTPSRRLTSVSARVLTVTGSSRAWARRAVTVIACLDKGRALRATVSRIVVPARTRMRSVWRA